MAAAGQAIGALRGGLQGRERCSDPRRSREHVAAAALRQHVLPVRRVADHAAVHRERHLEHPREGEGDSDGAGCRPDRAPGGRLPAQQQADAAAQRPHRAVLPQVLEEEGEREAVSLVDAPRSMFGDDDDAAVSLVFALGSGKVIGVVYLCKSC
uniref:Uncharacterized protein n=1 Tax=Aegilops tauschii subsp. strangulata TaxID=200361 RepID=A0A453BXV1_AEGTS